MSANRRSGEKIKSIAQAACATAFGRAFARLDLGPGRLNAAGHGLNFRLRLGHLGLAVADELVKIGHKARQNIRPPRFKTSRMN